MIAAQCCGENTLYDLELLTDGSIIASWQADDNTGINPYPYQQGWLLHIDSNGCLLPTSCGITSVEETPSGRAGEGQVRLYPNPATTHITIITTHNLTSNTLTILNTIGQVVFTQNIQSNEKQINVTTLPQGLYVVQVIENNQVIQYKKFIKE